MEDDETDTRVIMWAYSILGDTGKSYLKSHLVRTFGALVVDPMSGKDIKHAIYKRMHPEGEPCEADQLFQQNPVVIVDIPRPASHVVQRHDLYCALEEIQGDFHSTKYQGGQVSWGDVSPKVIVFANEPPAVDKLSTDRLQVFKINSHTLDMRKDTTFDAELEAQAAEFTRQDTDKEAAIDAAPPIDPSDTETFFSICYELSVDSPAILSEKVHQMLRRAGYNQSKKAMNAWLRDYAQTHETVREINRSHKVAWKGFKPLVPN
jgi:hypothetical protein